MSKSVRYEIEGCDNSHDWRLPFGGVKYFIVNGQQKVNKKICRWCLHWESDPQAEQPCDHLFDRAHAASQPDHR